MQYLLMNSQAFMYVFFLRMFEKSLTIFEMGSELDYPFFACVSPAVETFGQDMAVPRSSYKETGMAQSKCWSGITLSVQALCPLV